MSGKSEQRTKNTESPEPRSYWGFIGAILIGVGVWQLLVVTFDFPDYILPAPWHVFTLIVRKWRAFGPATVSTAAGAGLGFLTGCSTALLIGMAATLSRRLRQVMEPMLVFSQTFPIQAVAPLLVIWFGRGMLPKVVASALICFFPLTIAAIRALVHVDRSLVRVTSVLGAGDGRTLLKLRLPAALPEILSALKVCSTLSVIGAVIGEFVNPQQGLGYVIRSGQSHLQIDSMFAALLLLGLVGLLFYSATAFLERQVLRSRHLT